MKMRHLAQATIYWPRMNADIADYVNQCKICTQHKAKQAIQPMLPRVIPDTPWQVLASDIFTFNNKEYLIINDTSSKYPFMYQMSSKTADTIIQKLQHLISQYSPPRRLSTDNGPPLSSGALAGFLSFWCINHITSSTHYPKSNSFIEQLIKTIKTVLSQLKPQESHLKPST